MRLIFIMVLAACALSACNEQERERNKAATGNPEVRASLYATIEGCRIYQLLNSGNQPVYFSKCGPSAGLTEGTYRSGKTTYSARMNGGDE